MENIRQAIERAKVLGRSEEQPSNYRTLNTRQPELGLSRPEAIHARVEEAELDRKWLESKRIVAYNAADLRSRSFDMLRTQVLQSMDLKGWTSLGVTSPTAACGKTMTAVNLAFSIARQHERSVLLVDMDLQKPQVAKTLGLECEHGLMGVLQGRSTLADAVTQARIGDCQVAVLPAEAATPSSSEWMASRTMNALLKDLRKEYSSHTVIFDLPPLLSSDDVIAIAPQIDCVLLVAAVGTSTVAEIKQCASYLQSTEVIRVVVNKVEEPSAKYYYGSARS
jgi:capsular exopolysaccharide synthesis family protein